MLVGVKRQYNRAAALVTIVLCNVLLLQITDPADWAFVTLGPLNAVLSLEAVALVYIVTRWSGSGLISMANWFHSCVKIDIKPLLTHLLSLYINIQYNDGMC